MIHTISEMSVLGNTVSLWKETGNGLRVAEYIVGLKYPDVNRIGESYRSVEYEDALTMYEQEVKNVMLRELHRYPRKEQVKNLGAPKNPE